MTRTPERQTDERILHMLSRRRDGATCKQIAAEVGCTASAVRGVTIRVRNADISESGEPDAAQAYWRDR